MTNKQSWQSYALVFSGLGCIGYASSTLLAFGVGIHDACAKTLNNH